MLPRQQQQQHHPLAPEGRPEDQRRTQLYRRIGLILRAGFWLSLALMLAGVTAAIIRGEEIGDDTDALGDVLPGALRLDPRALVDLGILVLLATPAAYVLVALVTFLRQRDRLFAGVCVALIAIIAGSVGVALL